MSDLLSPILFVMDDESEAFWCFVALMERLGPNFNRDQNGMHSQLFALSKVFFSLLQTTQVPHHYFLFIRLLCLYWLTLYYAYLWWPYILLTLLSNLVGERVGCCCV